VREDTVARNYAETLFELADRHEGVEAFGAGVDSLATLMDDPTAREFLVTPRVSAADKKAAETRGVTRNSRAVGSSISVARESTPAPKASTPS